MSKFLVFVTIAILVLASLPANACHNMRPDQGDLQRYQSIFVGEVTGIRLTGLENKRLRKPDVCDIEKDGKIGECFNLTGGDEPTTIFSIPIQVVKGSVAGVQEL